MYGKVKQNRGIVQIKYSFHPLWIFGYEIFP